MRALVTLLFNIDYINFLCHAILSVSDAATLIVMNAMASNFTRICFKDGIVVRTSLKE